MIIYYYIFILLKYIIDNMNLNQVKLTKSEWNSTEIPVEEEEQEILNLIIKGFEDPDYIYNKNNSMINFIKIPYNENVENYLYKEYFKEIIDKLCKKYDISYNDLEPVKLKRVNSTEEVRLENIKKNIENCGNKIFEFYLLHICELILKYYKKEKYEKFYKYYYTLSHLNKLIITNINKKVKSFIEIVLLDYYVLLDKKKLFSQAYEYIENNHELDNYKDYKLYQHQKDLFSCCKNANPKLVLYIAPTGTGKTLSPLGLSQQFKIIFVCAARHVGLALAKSSISMNKKIAFAFGCEQKSDIRLHNFTVNKYVYHKYIDDETKICTCSSKKCNKIGKAITYKNGSKKIDHSDGKNVEIMITDINSYLVAMEYMCDFNDKNNLIMYWDEPTITLDYEDHELHPIISNTWKKNIIPNIILSSATLPHKEDLINTINNFKEKYEHAIIYNITSHDCNKSIPIINSSNFVEMPHLKYENYDELRGCIEHSKKNKTLLRYFDLEQIIKFIIYMEKKDLIKNEELKINKKYDEIENITMNNIKMHYLDILHEIDEKEWSNIYTYFNEKRKPKYTSNIKILTEDSHTLTDGPTIFLSNNVEKISKALLQSAKIPQKVLENISNILEKNDILIKQIKIKEQSLEDILGDEIEKERKMMKDIIPPEAKQIKGEINKLLSFIENVKLNDLFVPNKLEHLKFWSSGEKKEITREFSCNISPDETESIMKLDVQNNWKLLLLLGIGVFSENNPNEYIEMMKKLAQEQKLFLIIASSDYIYGTNYQFCHGYLSKDIENMTQEKTIQAMGRIGRNQIQKSYSIRFRDDTLIHKIFQKSDNIMESKNMNKLFCN